MQETRAGEAAAALPSLGFSCFLAVSPRFLSPHNVYYVVRFFVPEKRLSVRLRRPSARLHDSALACV